METLYELRDVHGVHVDAFVTDTAHQLLFASLWGRDTAIQQLLARLSLPTTEGGLYRLVVTDPDQDNVRHELVIGAEERLTKLTARMPKANLFGEVTQVWLFDRLASRPDPATRRALRLIRAEGEVDPKSTMRDRPFTWELFKKACHLPLLDDWRETLLDTAIQAGWLSFKPGTGVHAVMLDLSSEEVERTVEGLIQRGSLTLGAEEPVTVVVALPSPSSAKAKPQFSTDAGSKRLTSDQLDSALFQFTGTTQWFRHWAVKEFLYTDGVQFFANEGGQNGAYWFLDVVATEFFELQRRHPFIVIVLSVTDSRAIIRVEDGNGKPIRDRAIDYTDMQVGDWKFYLTENVLLLLGEY